MVIKRFSNMLGSRHGANPFSRTRSSDGTDDERLAEHGEDTPEGIVGRSVRLFCESGGPNNQGEEVLHLPTIVESAESSPAAAQIAAQQIRKFLTKENYGRPHVQYNAIMLIRILSDNPGATFTRNIDQKFTATVKELLRNCKDQNVQQILKETLQALYMEKAYDTNLQTLFQMWSRESGLNISQSARAGQIGRHSTTSPSGYPQGPHGAAPPRPPRPQPEAGLPTPVELAARIEEAKTSAKLLQQLVQSTPPGELQGNELISEFAERCHNAQRSMHGFMNCTNPPPDDDTMQTLIETSEQLSLAASKHQRAVLQARRSGNGLSPQPGNVYSPPPVQQAPTSHPLPNTGYSSPGAPPASTFVPAGHNDPGVYSPPPVPPPSMRANLDRRSNGEEYGSDAVPVSPRKTVAAPQIPPINTAGDNPFADSHTTHADPSALKRSSMEPISASSAYDEYDDPYRLPSAHPSHTSETYLPPSAANHSAGASQSRFPDHPNSPPNVRHGDSWQDPVRANAGSPTSYHPGFTSTPSYMKRQESSGDNLTMRGAGAGAAPPIMEEERSENNRHSRYGSGAGRPSMESVPTGYGVAESATYARPQIPAGYARGGGNISPVSERAGGSWDNVSPVSSRGGGGGGGGATQHANANGSAGYAGGYRY